MWIHRFLLNINPQHVGAKVVFRAIFLVPWIYYPLHNRMYMLCWKDNRLLWTPQDGLQCFQSYPKATCIIAINLNVHIPYHHL